MQNKEEYDAWAARIKRSHDIIRAQTIDDLHNAGWRIVKTETVGLHGLTEEQNGKSSVVIMEEL